MVVRQENESGQTRIISEISEEERSQIRKDAEMRREENKRRMQIAENLAQRGIRKQRFEAGIKRAWNVLPSKQSRQFNTKGVLALAGAFGVPTGVGPQGYKSQSKKGYAGRGRPRGSYKYYIPGQGQVSVFAHRKYVSQIKRQIALANELRKARLSAVMPEDPRYQQSFGADEAWMNAEQFPTQDIPIQGQQMPMQQPMPSQMRRPMPQRSSGFFKAFGFGQNEQVNMPGQQMSAPMSAGAGLSGTPQLNFWGNGMLGGGSSILRARSIFNNPGETQVMP